MGKRGCWGRCAPCVALYSDASNWGFATIYESDWVVETFIQQDAVDLSTIISHHWANSDRECQGADINRREMWAANRWCSHWRDKNVVFVTDNLTEHAALGTGRCKSKLIMACIRQLFWQSCRWNFSIESVHIPYAYQYIYHTICDALSCWNECSSKNRIASVDPSGTLCCPQLFTN